MYQQAVERLAAAADGVAEYRADLVAFADTLDGKRWGVEVTGPIKDMTGELVALEGDYRDLAAQIKHQGDQGAAAHEQAPWVPDNLLDNEYPTFTSAAAGSAVMADATEPTPADEPDFAAIAARLRDTDTEDEGRAYLDAQKLDKQGLLAVAAALGLSRLEPKSAAELKRRVIKQAIGARRKYQGLREGWQARPGGGTVSGDGAEFTPTRFEAPPPEVLQTGRFAQHKLLDPVEDRELQAMIGEFFDPMQDKDPRLLKDMLDSAPEGQRDAWSRRADEIARAWGSSLDGPGSLFEHIKPADAGTDSKRSHTAEPAGAGEAEKAPAPKRRPRRTPSTRKTGQPKKPPEADRPPARPKTKPAPLAPAAEPAAPKPVSGWPSDKPIAKNTWGGFREEGAVHYHDDGPIGDAVRYMGRRDARMDVDGEPLANVLGQIATDVVCRRRTAQQAVNDLKTLHERLPEDTHAHLRLGIAIKAMDGPATPVPDIPEGAPESLRNLVHALHAVPIVRADPSKELEPLLKIIDGFAAGRQSADRVAADLKQLRNRRHESLGDAGKFEIDRAIEDALKAF